jgi:glucan phosphorylase
MTFVGLHLSHYISGVTKRHGEVSRSMFLGYPIGSITNGVHSISRPPSLALLLRPIYLGLASE